MHFSPEEEDNSFSLKKFESMLKTNKVFFFDSEEFEDIIYHYIDTGKMNLAKKALKLGLEQHPKSIDLKLIQAEILIIDEKYDAAEKILNEVYQIEPANEEIYIHRANIFSKKDMHKEAIEQLELALEYTDDEAEIYHLMGMEYLLNENLEKAKENFINCLELDQDDYSSLYNVVYCFDFMDQNNEAIVFLESYIDKNPYSEVAWHQLGRQYYTIKNYEKALWAFDYACLIDESFVGAFLEKAKSLEKLKRYEEAIEAYEAANQLDDPTPFSFLRIGRCFEKLGNDELALQYYLQTVHEDPLLDKGWICICDFYIKKADYHKALIYLNKAIAIDGENHLYWNKYANINMYLGFFEEAELGFRKSHEYGNIELPNYLYWSESLHIIGETSAALAILGLAEEYYKEESEITYREAAYHILSKNENYGLELLNIALIQNFENKQILKDFFPLVWENPKVQKSIQKFLM